MSDWSEKPVIVASDAFESIPAAKLREYFATADRMTAELIASPVLARAFLRKVGVLPKDDDATT